MNRKILVGLFFSLYCSLTQAETLVMAQNAFSPFIYDDPDNPGISVDIVKEALKAGGYEIEFQIMPWARALQGAQDGTVHLLPAAFYNDERATFLDFSDKYLDAELTFFKRSDDDFIYSTIDSLTGKSVGVIKDYGYTPEFLAATNFDKPESVDLPNNLKKLQASRIDLTIEDKYVVLNTIAKEGLNRDNFDFAGTLAVTPIYLASSKANPKSQEVIAAFNKGLQEIQSNGTFDALLQQYNLK